MTLFLRPDCHRSEYHHGRAPAGYPVTGPEVSVELADEGGLVELHLDPLPGETFDDRTVSRSFQPEEARQLAAALWHFADEAERR